VESLSNIGRFFIGTIRISRISEIPQLSAEDTSVHCASLRTFALCSLYASTMLNRKNLALSFSLNLAHIATEIGTNVFTKYTLDSSDER